MKIIFSTPIVFFKKILQKKTFEEFLLFLHQEKYVKIINIAVLLIIKNTFYVILFLLISFIKQLRLCFANHNLTFSDEISIRSLDQREVIESTEGYTA